MRRIKLTLAYDGTDFHGWQVQPGLVTIQGTLEQVFAEIEGQTVHVAGSGRTDAGVHALGQAAAVSLSNPIPLVNLRRAANRLLPPSIRILEVEEAALDFHPRHHAASKTYEYRLFRGEVCPPVEWRYVHQYPYPLDLDGMMALAPLLEGHQDFAAFAAADDRVLESTVRTIFSSRLEAAGDHLIYRVSGSGFLKHMVRNIVGTFLEAGKGNLDADGLREFLTPGCGKRAGPTAPAKGLFLVQVDYGRRETGTNNCVHGEGFE
ncbi:MAG: tRNA pseudouridine(38-40) synthase TruA [Acidobacteriia bacterium]|nr:tRNA pseudouridine(38-40) synthase TruA [Terriglobia bacterium]